VVLSDHDDIRQQRGALWALGLGARRRSLLPAVRAAGEYPARDQREPTTTTAVPPHGGVSLLDGWSLLMVNGM
jgi:hypothetical protein